MPSLHDKEQGYCISVHLTTAFQLLIFWLSTPNSSGCTRHAVSMLLGFTQKEEGWPAKSNSMVQETLFRLFSPLALEINFGGFDFWSWMLYYPLEREKSQNQKQKTWRKYFFLLWVKITVSVWNTHMTTPAQDRTMSQPLVLNIRKWNQYFLDGKQRPGRRLRFCQNVIPKHTVAHQSEQPECQENCATLLMTFLWSI